MRQSSKPLETSPAGKAAFRIDARAFRAQPLERLVDDILTRVFAGRPSWGLSPTTCTSDSCTFLKPPTGPPH
jgi:hypothetical protein